MPDPIAIASSVLSLGVASLMAWLTLFVRATVRMTQPTVIFFGPGTPRSPDEPTLPKVYLRTLLVSTSRRGRVIESMHVALSRNETHQNFNIWVYGQRDQLMRGSGLFVGETGIGEPPFLMPRDRSAFQFTEDQYRLDVVARLLGDRKPTLLFSQELAISRDLAAALAEPGTGLYFDWGAGLRPLPAPCGQGPALAGPGRLYWRLECRRCAPVRVPSACIACRKYENRRCFHDKAHEINSSNQPGETSSLYSGAPPARTLKEPRVIAGGGGS
jgi:hypothetical protein